MDASIFNNVGSAIGGALMSNINKSSEEESWMNRTGWFGSYAGAQEKINEYMAANKERIPMVIEYLTGPGKSKGGSNRKAVTMYINPSRLQFKNQKVKSKTITRGGIFYHHWGDDNMVMSLSGSCGYSGMSGIKKLDEIYRMSGVLLAYDENSQGPVYTDGDTDLLNDIMKGDFSGALGQLISGKKKFSDFAKAAKRHAIGGAIDAITGRKNSGLQSSKIAQKVRGTIAGGMQNMREGIGKTAAGIFGDSKIGTAAAGVFAGAVEGYATGLAAKALGMSDRRKGALDYLDENVVTFEDAYSGFSDIIDELEDPWRPRQVWIYFEDHVYIGHFDSFNYSRVAETPNISYEMSFTVIREIVITSYSPSLPGFVPAQIV